MALAALCPVAAAQNMEAGAARIDITAPVGTPLNGYGARMGQNSVDVHDPIWARTLYLDDGETRLFWAALDLCYVNRELRDRVLALAPEEVPRENIILTATHTHNGHGAMDRRLVARWVTGRYMPDVLEETARRIAQSMHEAYQARRRAGVGYGTGKQNVLSANRRIDGGPIDEQIGVIRIDDSDGNAIAIIANFAAHPTTVPDENLFSFSSDYLHFYYNKLEELTSPGCVAMFANGALGDQRCASPEGTSGWARTEAVGRLLAIRVKEVANGILAGPVTLRLGHARPALPPTLAAALQPKDVFLQSLEINDLLVNFFPGEPCVEIGLGLRKLALDRGYKAQFSVGCANDYLNYFITRETYHRFDYECGMNFFGPGISDWFQEEFGALMTLGEAPAQHHAAADVAVDELDGGLRIVLEGSPRDMGRQRGAAFRETIRARYFDEVENPLKQGRLAPSEGLWSLLPPFLDPVPLALPVMGIRVRPLLTGVGAAAFAEIEGMAEGAELPFDAFWLTQVTPYLAPMAEQGALFESPFCTMFAVTGEQAGADSLLVGRNMDWPGDDAPVLIDSRPAEGMRYVHVGFPWNVGVFSGMNSTGLVLCAERIPGLGSPGATGQPLEMALRGLLATATTQEEALEALQALSHVRGYHVLIADGEGSTAVIEMGDSFRVRTVEEGILLGAEAGAAHLDNDGRARYGRVSALLDGERIVDPNEVAQVLSDATVGETGRARIWNHETRHSIVFEPMRRRMRVVFPTERGGPGTATVITVDPATAEVPAHE
jgi:hypothetical protein